MNRRRSSPDRPTPPSHSAPTESPRRLVNEKQRRRRVLGVAGLVVSAALLVLSLIYQYYVVSLLCLAGMVLIDRALVGAMARLFHRPPQAERGPAAERSVAATLPEGDDQLLVLNNVPGPYGDLDHIIFRGNGSVVVIDTNPHQGRITEFRGDLRINGQPFEKDILRQIHRNALWLRDQLRDRYGIQVFVNAILVFPNAFVAVRRPVGGVEIATQRFLPNLLRRLPANAKVEAAVRTHLQALKTDAGSWHHARVP